MRFFNRTFAPMGALSLAVALCATSVSYAIPQDQGGAGKSKDVPAKSGDSSKQDAGAATAGGVAVQFNGEFDKSFGTAKKAKDATKEARAYLKSRKWVEGTNDPDADPDDQFIIVIGSAGIQKGDADTFDERRQEAALKALLDAKAKMAIKLNAWVQAKTKLKYAEKNADPLAALNSPKTKDLAKSPDAIDKVQALFNAKLDKALREEKIDPATLSSMSDAEKAAAKEKSIEQAKKLLKSTTEFSDAVKIAAEHEVSGLQSFRTFESSAGKAGDIAVIAIHSEKSRALQRALLGMGSVPPGAPNKSVSDWIDSLPKLEGVEDPEDVLLYTHGVQMRTDENGELVLVGFGQSYPIGDEPDHLDAAKDKAEVQAQGQLRRFMGEFITLAKEDARSSTLEAYKDGSSQFTNTSKFDKDVDSELKELSMKGMEPVYSWNQRHPGSDRDTYGAVVVWSVKRALEANKLSDQLKAAGGAAGGTGIGDKRASTNPPEVTADEAEKKKKKGTNGGTNGGGAEGETP
jgi:hypothetical protein